jgi:hypothetical protein
VLIGIGAMILGEHMGGFEGRFGAHQRAYGN